MEDKNKMLTNDWNNIHEANSLINTIELKGKQYAEVKERVIAFRRVHPLGQIITELSFSDNYVNCEAMIFNETDKLLAKGHAREYLKVDSAIEKCETSAIGRALGFCGYGISTSISSAEDMEEVNKPEIFDEPPLEELIEKATSLLSKQELVDLLNCVHKVDLAKVPSYLLMSIIRHKEDEKHNPNK